MSEEGRLGEEGGADAWREAALRPNAIAVIGASENPEKIGGRPIKYMLERGYRGRLYPVNPSRPEIQGLKAYADIEAVPEVPDMAVVCVPGDAAVNAVKSCARRGVRVCVVISSGFGETGPEGRRAQDAMVMAAHRSGMRLVGPNTQGLANFRNGAIASFATLIGEVAPSDGPVVSGAAFPRFGGVRVVA
jgi:acyl-CoA synthetase (NDP forming)